MTGALWRSAFVAAVFAIHRAAGGIGGVGVRAQGRARHFFLHAHGRRLCPLRPVPKIPGALFAVVLLFALGLLCKPLAVTLPLFCCSWITGLFNGSARRRQPVPSHHRRSAGNWGIARRLILEKIPLMALAAAACGGTWFAARKEVIGAAHIAMPVRLDNACISCFVYLRQMVWPAGLAVYYPCPEESPPSWKSPWRSFCWRSFPEGFWRFGGSAPGFCGVVLVCGNARSDGRHCERG